LKVLRGNPGLRKLNENEPCPPLGTVEKPAGLSAGAGVVWDELAPICLHMGTLTVADARAFAMLCQLQATANDNELLRGTSEFNARLERDTAATIRPYYEYFGLTPASRARISVPKPQEPASKWAGLK
jgi:hypothetical protein